MLPAVVDQADKAEHSASGNNGSIEPDGRLKGILAGANVVMPNLSPVEVRSKYILYDNKLSTGSESAQNLEALKRSLASIGFSVAESRGDIKTSDGKN